MIRQLQSSDFELWSDIRLEAVKDSPFAFGISYEETLQKTQSDWEFSLQSAWLFAYIEQGTAAAVAGYFIQPGERLRHRGKIFSVYVRPSARGKGIMDRLIQTILQHARSRGMEQMHLDVGTYNTKAIACYERNGFAIYGMEPHALKVDGTYIDEYIMMQYL